MRKTDIRKEAKIRLNERRNAPDLAEMVGAHLNDCDLVLVFQREDGQRGAGLVVEIALRFHHVKFCAERGCHDIFGRGFSRAAGEPDDGNRKLVAITFCDGVHCFERIRNE